MNYKKAILLNKKVVKVLFLYKQTEDKKHLYTAYQLLRPVIVQECWKAKHKRNLPHWILEDFQQEAFLKLVEVLNHYDWGKPQTFTSFFRKSLQRHLTSVYRIEVGIDERDPGVRHTDKKVLRLFVEDLLTKYKKEFPHPVARRILTKRLLCFVATRPTQNQLAEETQVTQSYISKWEIYLKNKIQAEMLFVSDII